MTTDAPQGIAIPDSVETRLGSLEFFEGFSSDATVKKLYDNFDFQRAVQAYLPITRTKQLVQLRESIMNKRPFRNCCCAILALVLVGFMSSPGAWASESKARELLKGMSDFISSQQAMALDFDATYEVVTNDGQKLGLASSGSVTLNRPNRIRASRHGGFVHVETVFDGTTLTLLGRNTNVYIQIELPGTVDNLIDELRDTYGRPLPAADLLVANPYAVMMEEVVDVKDLGSGVIGGMECDWLAFRTDEVDWQIWIAQGERPYPCRYVITNRQVAHSPQYTVDFRNWRFGTDATGDFEFKSPAGATKIELEELREHIRDLPGHFTIGEKP